MAISVIMYRIINGRGEGKHLITDNREEMREHREAGREVQYRLWWDKGRGRGYWERRGWRPE